MKQCRRLVMLVSALTVLSAVASYAQEPVDPVLQRQEVWFRRTPTPLTNLDARSGQVPTWDTAPPSSSTPLGAGGIYASNHQSHGTFSNGREHNPVNGFTAQGNFTGDIDTLAVTLYGHVPFYLASPGCAGGVGLSFDLQIDGVSILYQSQSSPSAYLKTEVLDPGFVSVKFRFTKIFEAMQEYGVATGPDVSHDVYLNAMNFYACNEVVWVYDSTEAPAGAIFNLADSEAATYTDVDVFNPPPPYSG